jgi:hypothetical protein
MASHSWPPQSPVSAVAAGSFVDDAVLPRPLLSFSDDEESNPWFFVEALVAPNARERLRPTIGDSMQAVIRMLPNFHLVVDA